MKRGWAVRMSGLYAILHGCEHDWPWLCLLGGIVYGVGSAFLIPPRR